MNSIYGLSNGNNVYVHYKRDHFNWHRKNSPDFDFTGIENRYKQITLNNYRNMAKKAQDKELASLKRTPQSIDEIISVIATFNPENLDMSVDNLMNIVTSQIQDVAGDIGGIASTISNNNMTATIDQKMNQLSTKIAKLETLVGEIQNVNVALTDYLLQSAQSKRQIKNMNAVLIDRDSLLSLERILTNLNSIKSGISQGKMGNFFVTYKGNSKIKTGPVSFALLSIQNDLQQLASSTCHAIAVAAASEALKELNGKTINNVKMEVKNINSALKSHGSNRIDFKYNTKDWGQVSFKLPTAAPKKTSKRTSISSTPVQLKNYLHQVRWQARYLMFNGMMFGNTALLQPFYNYIASRGIQDLISKYSFGNNFIFLESMGELVSTSDFYGNIVSSRKFPTLSTSGSQSIPNKWAGSGTPRYVNDDLDELRPVMAWKRAKAINKVIQNLQVKIIYH